MKKSVFLKVVLTAIYAVGVCLTVYFGIVFCIHSNNVANPDAMLPVADWEWAYFMMAAGFPFMLASAASVIWVYGLRKTAHPKRDTILALIPAIIDGIPFLFCVGLLVVMLVKGYLEALGIIQ